MKKLGLALGAGGSRGVAHIGFLKALEEKGVKPAYIAGASMGAVVGAGYAAGIDTEEMWAAVCEMKPTQLLSFTLQRGGVCSSRKMRSVLKRYYGDMTFEDLNIPFRCVAVDMRTQKLVEISEGNVLDAVLASSNIPILFRPIVREGKWLIDGGVLERVPARQVKDMGAEVVAAVDVLGWRKTPAQMKGTLSMALSMLDMMDNYRAAERRKENADIVDFWLEPELGDMSQYAFHGFEFAYKKGYESGKKNAAKIKKALK